MAPEEPRPAPPTGRAEQLVPREEQAPRLWAEGFEYGTGVWRRRVRVVEQVGGVAGRASGELEDDMHHFRVEIDHDGTTLVAVRGSGIRGPWTTCMEAGEPLRAIEGHPITSTSTGIGRYTDATRNCTHMFDLAGLLVAQIARGPGQRQYDFEVADRSGPAQAARATAWRDGEHVLEWELEGLEVVGPPEWAEAPIRNRFMAWAEANLDPDMAEAAIALRRVIGISQGRMGDLDRLDEPSSIQPTMGPVCHTFQPEVTAVAVRHKGSARDLQHRPELLLSDMHLRDDEPTDVRRR